MSMEEKRYPIMEEETGMDVACEPVAAVTAEPMTMTIDNETAEHDWIDDLDWDRFPSFGPFSEEDAIARIEEAERDLEDPSKWITSEQMWERLYNKYPWLR